MRPLTMMTAALFVVAMSGGVFAQEACDTVRSDLMGDDTPGESSMNELSASASAGNCDAAADLARRAKDDQGLIETHCPNDKDLKSLATAKFRLGLGVLKLPQCQN